MRRAGGHPLETVAVERADAAESRRILRMPPHRHVTHLRMKQSVEWPAAHDGAAAYARTHRQIESGVAAASRAPAPLREGGGVDVGVERHGDGEGGAQRRQDVGAGPSRLRSAQDLAVGGRHGAQIERSEHGDAQTGEGADLPLLLAEEGDRTVEGGRGRAGLERGRGADVVRPAADRADELGSAALYAAVEAHRPLPCHHRWIVLSDYRRSRTVGSAHLCVCWGP